MKKLSFSFTTAAIVGLLILNSFTAMSMLNSQALPTAGTEWQLSVIGLVSNPLNLTLTNITAMPQTTVEAAIYCVDFPTQVVASGSWTGVKLATLLEQAGALPSAVKVAFYAADGYSTDLDLETATRENVILAYEKDGAPLAETLRLVVPEKWGYKWISQITSIVLVNYDFKGTWESQGYSDEADVQSGTSHLGPQSEPTVPTPSQPNVPVAPSSGSQLSNSSAAQPPQETQSSNPEPEPQTSGSFPIVWVTLGIAVIVVCACLLVYVKKRRDQSRFAAPIRGI
jgi:hypothetical protein